MNVFNKRELEGVDDTERCLSRYISMEETWIHCFTSKSLRLKSQWTWVWVSIFWDVYGLSCKRLYVSYY